MNKKITCEMETQTVIHCQSDVSVVPLGDIIRGFVDPEANTPPTHNPFTGRAETSTLVLREDSIDIVINKIRDRVKRAADSKKQLCMKIF